MACSNALTASTMAVMADSSPILKLRALPSPMTRGFTVHHLVRSGVLITRDADGTWAVYGHEAERAAAVDSTDHDGRMRAEAHLMRLGVDDELAMAGASPGDLVRIGRLELDCVAT